MPNPLHDPRHDRHVAVGWDETAGVAGTGGYRPPDVMVQADGRYALRIVDQFGAAIFAGTHDLPAGLGVDRQGLTAYLDPSVLPADVSADGDDVRATGSRKGETFAYKSRLDFYEDGARGTARVERQGTASGRAVASGVIVAAGTAGRMYGLVLEWTAVGGITFNLRADGVIGGAIIMQFVRPAGAAGYDLIDLLDWPYSNGLYGEINAGAGAFNVTYRNG